MKRPWLTTGLVAAVALFSAAGINHAARVSLDRGIARFRAALPDGAAFTYASARPALLTRGAVLTDVVLHVGDRTFRAARLRVGHVAATAEGGLSLSRLDLREPSVQTPQIIAHGGGLTLSGLILPPAAGDPLRPDPAHVTVARARLDQLSAQFPEPRHLDSGFALLGATLSALDVEQYGPGKDTRVTADTGRAVFVRQALPGAPLPPAVLRSFQLSAGHLALRERDLSSRLAVTHVSGTPVPRLESLEADTIGVTAPEVSFGVDHITGKGDANTVERLETKGLHLRWAGRKLPLHIDGAHSGIVLTQERSAGNGGARSETDLTIPDLATLRLSMDLAAAPALSPAADFPQQTAGQEVTGPQPPARPEPLRLARLALAFQGDRLVRNLPSLAARQRMDDDTQDQLRAVMARSVAETLSPYPALAALADFLARPDGRTLTLAYTPAAPVPLSALNALARQPAAALALLATGEVTASAR